jgi:CelD/BcsL family acetyltransferase involved in cellulose biosynthesis
MTTVEIDKRVRTVRVLAEVEELKDFWASCPTHRDADFDFYLFYLRNSPEVVRPHVIVLYRDGRPHAMLVGRLETRGVDIRFGYIRLIRLRLRALTFMYGGVLGDVSLAADAKDIISCIEESLRAGEADAAFLEYLPVDSPLYNWARSLPNPARVNQFAESCIHRIRTLANGKSFLQSLSSNHRRNQKRRVRRLAESFGDRVRIERFQDASALERLMEHAESIAEKSYQRGLGVGFANTPEMRKRLELEAQKKWLRAHILYLNDQPCSFWICSCYNGTLYSDFMGFDPEYSKYEPGMYLVINVIEEICRENQTQTVARIDFGIGDSEWKSILGNQSWREESVCIFAPTATAVGVNSLQTLVAAIDHAGRAILRRSNVLARVKRAWRSRIASG